MEQPETPAVPASDAELLARFACGGDMDAAAELISRHERELLRTAHALLGDAQKEPVAVARAINHSLTAVERWFKELAQFIAGEPADGASDGKKGAM